MSTDITLSERIYYELYEDITKQRLVSGQKLTLSMLQERFNVSHTPIREALSRLTSDGLVTYYSNCGMKVTEFSEIEIREIFQFTAELEALAVKFCQKAFTLAPLTRDLKLTIEEEQRAIAENDIEGWKKVAGKIHEAFYTYSENRYLDEAAEKMGARMELMTHIYSNEETYLDIHNRHLNIFHSIEDKDFDKAADLVREHLQFNMMYIVEEYRKNADK